MPRAALSSGIELEYETFGSPSDPTLLLVMGFTAQMIAWDARFCSMLADRGRHVVRFDNRDCGLSTHLDGVTVDSAGVLSVALTGEGEMPEVPYLLSDMAADGVGLLDHLGVDRAHVVGASMGGMIVQTMAIEHPHRLQSVVSIMSTTGAPDVGLPTPEAMEALLAEPPTDREAYIDSSSRWAVWASKRHYDPERARQNAAASYDRAFYPEGASRQVAAIFASGDRTERLGSLSVPMLVIHGEDDTLIHPSGGDATAAAVPGARLVRLADMGHDMPEPLWPTVVDEIIRHGDAAS
ncbi:MAG: alpha/beta hydrolase [Actinomycetota bacterium]|jgi:pimeloyl-ACP methyl ester carboxylesterase|nr:alpha/beta hydrolase [Actinomycetota bacterium]